MSNITKEQFSQVTELAVESLSEALGITKIEVIKNHEDEVFHLVCAFAAQAAA